jgi:hypothetical protein
MSTPSLVAASAGLAVAAALPYGRALGQGPGIARDRDRPIDTCDTTTGARPWQHGVTYAGVVDNGDYLFSAVIPPGLTGLGAAPWAPFHGFTVFTANSACFAFEIEHRVVLPDDHPRSHRRREERVPVTVGGRKGTETSRIGMDRGREFLNVTILIALPRAGYTNDVAIRFVTPLDVRATTEPVFRSFLASLRFRSNAQAR